MQVIDHVLTKWRCPLEKYLPRYDIIATVTERDTDTVLMFYTDGTFKEIGYKLNYIRFDGTPLSATYSSTTYSIGFSASMLVGSEIYIKLIGDVERVTQDGVEIWHK